MKFDKKAFGGDRKKAVEFENHGDGVVFTIVDLEMIADQHNPGRQIPRIDGVDVDGTLWAFYCRSAGQMDAMSAAVPEDGIEPGGLLEIRYTGDRQLKNGRVMKEYEATYTAPEAIGTAPFGSKK